MYHIVVSGKGIIHIYQIYPFREIQCDDTPETYLNVHSHVTVHVVKYSAQVSELYTPFVALIETEVIAEHKQHVIVLKKLGFATQLVKQITRP